MTHSETHFNSKFYNLPVFFANQMSNVNYVTQFFYHICLNENLKEIGHHTYTVTFQLDQNVSICTVTIIFLLVRCSKSAMINISPNINIMVLSEC